MGHFTFIHPQLAGRWNKGRGELWSSQKFSEVLSALDSYVCFLTIFGTAYYDFLRQMDFHATKFFWRNQERGKAASACSWGTIETIMVSVKAGKAEKNWNLFPVNILISVNPAHPDLIYPNAEENGIRVKGDLMIILKNVQSLIGRLCFFLHFSGLVKGYQGKIIDQRSNFFLPVSNSSFFGFFSFRFYCQYKFCTIKTVFSDFFFGTCSKTLMDMSGKAIKLKFCRRINVYAVSSSIWKKSSNSRSL